MGKVLKKVKQACKEALPDSFLTEKVLHESFTFLTEDSFCHRCFRMQSTWGILPEPSFGIRTTVDDT